MTDSESRRRQLGEVRNRLCSRTVPFTALLLLAVCEAAPLQVAASGGPPRTLPPVDQGASDTGFSAFRRELLKAAAQKDAAFVKTVMAEGIQGSFGDSPGKVSFAAYWKLDDPKSEFWPALQSVLSMGGTFLRQGGKRMFCAPYVFSQFPSELDPMKFLVVVHQDAALRAEPSLKSPVVRTTSYELVEAIGQDPLNGAAWVHVKTSAGEKGYLPRDAVRSPLEARACFVFKGGRWLIASFVRGD